LAADVHFISVSVLVIVVISKTKAATFVNITESVFVSSAYYVTDRLDFSVSLRGSWNSELIRRDAVPAEFLADVPISVVNFLVSVL